VSKYQFTESDIYLPGTDIPRNSLGIETPDLLHEVEATLLQQAYTRFITELAPAVRFDENPLTPPPHVMAGIEEQTLERLRET